MPAVLSAAEISVRMTDTTNPARLHPGRAGLGNGQHLTALGVPSRVSRPYSAISGWEADDDHPKR